MGIMSIRSDRPDRNIDRVVPVIKNYGSNLWFTCLVKTKFLALFYLF